MAGQQQSQSSSLSHLRVLDLTVSPLGALCGRVLGDLGADVIKIESSGGDAIRSIGPFAKDAPGPDRSLVFIDRGRSKRSVVLALSDQGDRQKVRALAKRSDVLIEDYQPGHLASIGLGYEDIKGINPGLVYVSITPFGQTGPHAGYLGGELIAQARGGILYANGDDAQRPCMAPEDLISQITCLHAAFGVLAALRRRRRTGLGQQVDVSRQEVVFYTQGNYIPRYSTERRITRREGRLGGMVAGVNLFTCKDGGFISLAPFMRHHFHRLASEVMRHPVMSDPSWADTTFRNVPENRHRINRYIEEYAATVDRDGFVEAGQAHGVPSVPVLTLAEAVHHPHNEQRNFFQELEHPAIGRYATPGAPFRMAASPWRIDKPAPRLGQHTAEVLQELEKEDGRGAPPAGSPGLGDPQGGHPLGSPLPKALEGLRIADFTRAFAGPIATMLLGFEGAEVIKVESEDLEDNRTGGQATFPELNRAKLSCTIDTRTERGKDLVKRLVAVSDVVIENFRPNVMGRLGLDYEVLREVKPDVIMVSMPGFGHSGPLKDYYAYGQQIIGTTGLLHLWGHPESPLDVRVKYAFPDYVAAIFGSLATLAALEYRDETGKGQFIELAQFEALAHLLGVAYMDYTVNGRVGSSRSNVSRIMAPHDVYPCKGEDSWCAIAVESDVQWMALVKTMGSPQWAADERFATLEGRVTSKTELDKRIAEWTAGLTRFEVEEMLQKAGVPAAALANAEDIYNDPHLRARGMIVAIDHGQQYGVIEHAGLNVHLTETPGRADLRSPMKGQDNDYVFRKVMGLSEQDMADLTGAGVLR
jgi:crotonobetainyl-CoA:carnitine CoA-transferase CaiB-like acyl-CoA transferase